MPDVGSTTALCQWLWFAAPLALCPPAPASVTFAGYVEADYVLAAPVQSGRIERVLVRKGQSIEAGADLFTLDDKNERFELAKAQARFAGAQADLSNLMTGRRPSEIAQLAASLDSAVAERDMASRDLERRARLLKDGAATAVDVDKLDTQLAMAKQKVAQQEAALAIAREPAREQEVRSAEERVNLARASLEQAQQALDERRVAASYSGVVEDVIRLPGEMAGPSAPVVSMMETGTRRLRMYVPQDDLARLRLGVRLIAHCEACSGEVASVVSYISPQPEFTPPVLYSGKSRESLVFLVESELVGDARTLPPGQIVDVELPMSQL